MSRSTRYPVELQERAVRMASGIRDEHESEGGEGPSRVIVDVTTADASGCLGLGRCALIARHRRHRYMGLLSIGNVASEFVWVYLNELTHSDMIEFGSVLPVSGDEAAWIEALDPTIRDIFMPWTERVSVRIGRARHGLHQTGKRVL